jgi:hypothetical protein
VWNCLRFIRSRCPLAVHQVTLSPCDSSRYAVPLRFITSRCPLAIHDVTLSPCDSSGHAVPLRFIRSRCPLAIHQVTLSPCYSSRHAVPLMPALCDAACRRCSKAKFRSPQHEVCFSNVTDVGKHNFGNRNATVRGPQVPHAQIEG